jgi:hypothetical protein
MVISWLRNLAATALTLSGISHIAGLWLHDIDLAVLVSASFGAVYLFIGIGLFGQSKFVLLPAIIVPAIGAWLALANNELSSFSTLGLAQLSTDFIIIAVSAIVLFSVRSQPSV